MSDSSSNGGRAFPLTRPPKRRAPRLQNLKKWDGAARTSYSWDPAAKDKALWVPTGNCRVYLYGYGESRREPSFKLPFYELQEQRCLPLIERYLVILESATCATSTTAAARRSHKSFNRAAWDDEMIDLYIPAPSRVQADVFYLAVRNFFAFLLRKSLVAMHLGSAIIQLLHSMNEYREPGVDNIGDLMNFLEEEGYLVLAGQSSHALAMLHFGESLRIRHIYTDAFAHCVGMADQLHKSSEYTHISPAARRAVRRTRTAMDSKLSRSSRMLQNFLDEDLSEQRLGLTIGARAHLDRFRAFVVSFYATKFGQWPPRGANSSKSIFSAEIHSRMAEDFGRLYEYLVDERFTISDSSPALAQGGICVLQSVEAFDREHGFAGLRNPLPLLPEVGGRGDCPISPSSSTRSPKSSVSSKVPSISKSSRRKSWFSYGRTDKPRIDTRVAVHAALLAASNGSREIPGNEFVIAYRRFEEELALSTGKQSDKDKVTLVDARKVRWILVYCTYQTLLDCTRLPKDVKPVETPYSLCIPTADLPIWEEDLVPSHSNFSNRRDRPPLSWANKPHAAPEQRPKSAHATLDTPTMTLEPDVNYYALTHPDESDIRGRHATIQVPPRGSSLTRGLGSLTGSLSRASSRNNSMRNNSIRRSIVGAFTTSPTPEPPMKSLMRRKPSKSSYQAIVIPGYGNGINDVQIRSASNSSDAAKDEAYGHANSSIPPVPPLPIDMSHHQSNAVPSHRRSRDLLNDRLDKRGSRYIPFGDMPNILTAHIPPPAAKEQTAQRTASTSSNSSAGTARSQGDFSTAPTTPLTDEKAELDPIRHRFSLRSPISLPQITVTDPIRRRTIATPPLPHRNPARPFSIVGTLGPISGPMVQEILGVEREFLAAPPSPNSRAPSPLRISKAPNVVPGSNTPRCTHQKPLGSHPAGLWSNSPPILCTECFSDSASECETVSEYLDAQTHWDGLGIQNGVMDNDFNEAWDQFGGLGGLRPLSVVVGGGKGGYGSR
ncbi:uncharacterized protein PgNI_01994 [Pyricularia grisea]|uniref:DUF8004 domain-containing protein n=1 Tax=Pyricularia grisea TaxID=148305 RepID=A0A6P8BJK9_PYRGI|nr:uncharacterized protein PgNI_01994 [Pyricularia grisea]TLD16869.1 hypothetical protein PgNI_01994 [Pyricularia grisea]